MSNLMSEIRCPHCEEIHNIRFSNNYVKGWNVVQCFQNTDDCEIATRGCGKYFNIRCVLVAVEMRKVE